MPSSCSVEGATGPEPPCSLRLPACFGLTHPEGPEVCRRGLSQPANMHPRPFSDPRPFEGPVRSTCRVPFQHRGSVVLYCEGRLVSSFPLPSCAPLIDWHHTTSRRLLQLLGSAEHEQFFKSCCGSNTGISRPVSFHYLSASIYPSAASQAMQQKLGRDKCIVFLIHTLRRKKKVFFMEPRILLFPDLLFVHCVTFREKKTPQWCVSSVKLSVFGSG